MWSALGWLGHWPSRLVRAWLGRMVWSALGWLGWLGLPTVGLAICLLRTGLFVRLAGDVRHYVVSIL